MHVERTAGSDTVSIYQVSLVFKVETVVSLNFLKILIVETRNTVGGFFGRYQQRVLRTKPLLNLRITLGKILQL